MSYTTFEYKNLTVSQDQITGFETLRVSCEVKNTGSLTGDEVVQVYLTDDVASDEVPKRQLVGFKRVHLAPDAAEVVNFQIKPRQFAYVNKAGQWVIEPGTFTVFVGGGQPGIAGGLMVKISKKGENFVVA